MCRYGYVARTVLHAASKAYVLRQVAGCGLRCVGLVLLRCAGAVDKVCRDAARCWVRRVCRVWLQRGLALPCCMWLYAVRVTAVARVRHGDVCWAQQDCIQACMGCKPRANGASHA